MNKFILIFAFRFSLIKCMKPELSINMQGRNINCNHQTKNWTTLTQDELVTDEWRYHFNLFRLD
jgi:hypothetical protein